MKEKATFAGGCFWCMEPPFDRLEGVIKTTVGYTGGHQKNPTYEEVCSGTTGHAEAVQIDYNPEIIDYQTLLKVFWRNIDPTAINAQFFDHGSQYRTAIFYHNDEQKRLAEESIERLKKKFPVVATEVVAVSRFYPAEEHHQNYYRKHPLRYQSYHKGSGRDQKLKDLWSD